MPTYQYMCTNCGEQLEAVQKFTDDPLTVCPACEGRLRKIFNSVGIVFKGSGFYRTDSRNGSGEKSSKGSDAVKTTNGSADTAGSASSSSGEPSGSASTSNGSSAGKSDSSPSKPANTGNTTKAATATA